MNLDRYKTALIEDGQVYLNEIDLFINGASSQKERTEIGQFIDAVSVKNTEFGIIVYTGIGDLWLKKHDEDTFKRIFSDVEIYGISGSEITVTVLDGSVINYSIIDEVRNILTVDAVIKITGNQHIQLLLTDSGEVWVKNTKEKGNWAMIQELPEIIDIEADNHSTRVTTIDGETMTQWQAFKQHPYAL